ncbi:hypothetical protein M0Q28_06370 [Patescibacteria group bacterium]|jgi:hypothetical protein|nr:hypothetical protein [Patescibacteria group bacterium]
MSKIGMLAVAVVAAAAGFAGAQYVQTPPLRAPKYIVSYDVHSGRQTLKPGTSLGCKAIADSLLLEKRVGEQNVEAIGKAGTDTASIKVADDGRNVFMLTGASLRGGATEGALMPIIQTTPDFIVAQRLGWPSYETLVIDIHSGNAVWTVAGYIVGMGTEAIYFQCD